MRNYIIFILCIMITPIIIKAEEIENEDLCLVNITEITNNTENLTLGYFNTDCITITNSNSYYVTDYYEINEDHYYIYEKNWNGGNTNTEYTCYYDENNNKLFNATLMLYYQRNVGYSYKTPFNNTNSNTYTIPKKVRYNIPKNNNAKFTIKEYQKCESEITPENPEQPQDSPDLTKITQITTLGVGLLLAIFLTRRKV